MAIFKLERKTYDTLNAIESFRSYWLENERLISNEAERLEEICDPDWNPRTEDDHAEFRSEKEMARYFHDKQMLPAFRYSCIVMLFIVVERELLRLANNLIKQNGPQKLQLSDIRGDLIERISKLCEAFFQLRIEDFPHYKSLDDLKRIRNCIVHCHGELDLLKGNADYLIALSQSRRGLHACRGTKIYICEPCIEQFIKEVQEFFEGVFRHLKWTIDDHCQGKRKA